MRRDGGGIRAAGAVGVPGFDPRRDQFRECSAGVEKIKRIPFQVPAFHQNGSRPHAGNPPREDEEGLPELDRLGIPVAMDFAKTGEQRTILEIIYSQLLFTRPFMMAPEVPRERVDAIRKAFQQALADPELIAEGAKMHLVIDAMPGEELERRIRALYATPQETIDKVRRVLSTQAQ